MHVESQDKASATPVGIQRRCRVAAMIITAALLATLGAGVVSAGGNQEELTTDPVHLGAADGIPVVLEIHGGEAFTHKLQIMPLIKVNNPPQIAAWCETPGGEFIGTLFVTDRVATGNWRSAPADSTPSKEISREEALPVWSHTEARTPDAVTSATPKGDFAVRTALPPSQSRVVVYVEVNNSGDFNETYPADAPRGSESYSGGEWGSGQPALVYAATVAMANLTSAGGGVYQLELIGHSSADGTDGRIREDLSGVTTARRIIEKIELVPGSL